MNCKKCKKEVPDGSAFCCFCGAKQTATTRSGKRGNGQGTAFKRYNTWTARWTVGFALEDGNIVQRYKQKSGFKTKREALAYAAAPPEEAQRIPTLSEYWALYEKGDMMDLSQSKQTAHSIAWKKWKPLAHKPIGELNIEILQATLDAAAPTYYPAKDMKTVLSHLYKKACAEGTARTNLAEYLHLPRLEEAEPEPFTEIEIRKFWDIYAGGDTFAGFILLLIYTGMMPGELLALKSDNIDWDAQQISGIGLKTKTRKKNALVFPDQIVPVLHDLAAHSNSVKGYVVGMNKDRFYKEYYATLERAGVRKLPPYSCRHTTATALALGKIAPSIIQKVMRHAKYSSTERYIHPDRADALAAVNALD